METDSAEGHLSWTDATLAKPFDTLTQGLSEEMIELKSDMDPGTGWVIGNEEICDYCDANFVCNRIATGEYVNSWYDKSKGACWVGRK